MMTVDVVCALEPAWRGRELKSRLEPSNVILAASSAEIDSALRARVPHLVVAGTRILTPPIERWIRKVQELPESPGVVLVDDEEGAGFQAAAIRAGCLAVLGRDLPMKDLAATIQALIDRGLDRAPALLAAAPAGGPRLRDFVSASPRMREFMSLASRLVDTDSSLLLLGETGTGKERLSRSLHAEGPRASGPFVAVNCGALPDSLAESELFGHEKGAFTGAARLHRGYFEQAEGGIVFLDEIGELPLHLQVKLLRVLEDRQVRRLGSERSFPVDIRLLAATNRDLERAVAAGRFREDLYYRLAVVTLTVPPLRERSEDVPALFESHVDSFRVALNRPVEGVEPAALEALVRYRWPGNVRELINVAERAVLLSPGPEIRLDDLPVAIASQAPGGAGAGTLATLAVGEAVAAWLGKPLQEARQEVLDDFERRYLRRLLHETGGRIGETARRAGINERSLYELMRRFGLRKEAFRVGVARGE